MLEILCRRPIVFGFTLMVVILGISWISFELIPEELPSDAKMVTLLETQIDSELEANQTINWAKAEVVIANRGKQVATLCGLVKNGWWNGYIFQITFIARKFSPLMEATNTPHRLGGVIPICPRGMMQETQVNPEL